MDLARARYLVSPAGRTALATLDPGLAALPPTALATHLRRDHLPAAAAALGEQLVLRAHAAGRLGSLAPPFLWTPAGLEMMTHPLVAARRAERIAALSLPVVDLTCGLGGDLAGIVERGVPALGVDRDPSVALFAQGNVPRASVVRGDARRPPCRVEGAAILLDPSRREGGVRRFDPAAFSPPWDAAVAVAAAARAGVIKASPGIPEHVIPSAAEVEWVQVGRTLREATIWLGAGACAGVRRAVLLPAGATLDSTAPAAGTATASIGAFVHDPESCVTNAGLVRHLGHRLGAVLLDEHVAYLTSDEERRDPLCATFAVLDVLAFGVGRLRERLRARGWRPDEIRRRAFPIEPDELRRLLGPVAGEPVTLLCTTLAGKRTVIAGRRVDRD